MSQILVSGFSRKKCCSFTSEFYLPLRLKTNDIDISSRVIPCFKCHPSFQMMTPRQNNLLFPFPLLLLFIIIIVIIIIIFFGYCFLLLFKNILHRIYSPYLEEHTFKTKNVWGMLKIFSNFMLKICIFLTSKFILIEIKILERKHFFLLKA